MSYLKKELFIILAALCGLVIIWFFLYNPKLKEINELRSSSIKMQQEIDNAISDVEKMPLLKKKIQELRSKVRDLQLRQRIEDHKTESDIIEILTSRLNKNVELITISTTDTRDEWFGFSVELECKRFSDLGKYIELLNRAPLVLKTKTLAIEKIQQSDFSRGIEVKLTIDVYRGKYF